MLPCARMTDCREPHSQTTSPGLPARRPHRRIWQPVATAAIGRCQDGHRPTLRRQRAIEAGKHLGRLGCLCRARDRAQTSRFRSTARRTAFPARPMCVSCRHAWHCLDHGPGRWRDSRVQLPHGVLYRSAPQLVLETRVPARVANRLPCCRLAGRCRATASCSSLTSPFGGTLPRAGRTLMPQSGRRVEAAPHCHLAPSRPDSASRGRTPRQSANQADRRCKQVSMRCGRLTDRSGSAASRCHRTVWCCGRPCAVSRPIGH